MKLNDVYYHPNDELIWIKPNNGGWQYGYTRLRDGKELGFENTSIYQKSLVFVTNTPTPDYTELCKLHPELFI